MSRLRIAMLTATFPPYYAGSGNACFYQARELARRGHDVKVLTATYPGVPVDPEGVRVERRRPLARIGNAPLIPSLAVVNDLDILHVHQPFIFGTDMALIARRLRGVPMASSFHNQLGADGLKGALFAGYDRTVTRAAVRRSAALTVLSLDHARSVPELAHELERRPEAFMPVPNGVDERFHPGESARRAQLGFAADDLIAIFCAKLDAAHRFKRLDLALGAIAAADDRRLRLLVIGGGDLEDAFKRQAETLGLAGRVWFVGDVPHEDIPDLFRTGDFLLLPSDGVESFGIVQVEAMATGLPVIAAALPGVRDVSVDGVHGFHVEPGSQEALDAGLRRMLALSTEDRRRMGEAGRIRVLERYTWARSAELLETAYRAVLPGGEDVEAA